MVKKKKQKRFLSFFLTIIMISSTIAMPQQFVLASQLSNINIVENDEQNNMSQSDSSSDSTKISETSSETTSEDANNSNSDVSTEGTGNNVSGENSEDTSEEISEDTSEEISEGTSEEISEDTSEEISEGTSEEISEGTSEEISEKQIENINEVDAPLLYAYDYNNFKVENGIITGWNNTKPTGDIVIPQYINGQKVTGIGTNVFNDNTLITKVDMPYITTIDSNAFFGCTALTKVDMPVVETIGSSAFSDCIALPTITIPSTTTSIGNNAFYNCIELKEIYIYAGDSLVLNDNLFSFAYSLKELYIYNMTNPNLKAFGSLNKLTTLVIPKAKNYSSIISKTKDTKSDYNKNETLKYLDISAAEHIRTDDVTSYIALETIIMPNVKTIDDQAFMYCTSLKYINTTEEQEKQYPDGYADLSNITYIGDDVFLNCTSLYTVDISNPDLTETGDQLFDGCTNLYEVKLSPSITVINELSFRNCYNLKTIDLSNITQVKKLAFSNCTSLKDLDLSNIKQFEHAAFLGCTGLEEVNLLNATDLVSSVFQNCTSLTKVNMPKVVNIGGNTFYECSALTTITIPSTTKTIGSRAFSRTKNLQTILIQQHRNGGVVPQGQDNDKVIVYYLDEAVTLSDEVIRTGAYTFEIRVYNKHESSSTNFPSKALTGTKLDINGNIIEEIYSNVAEVVDTYIIDYENNTITKNGNKKSIDLGELSNLGLDEYTISLNYNMLPSGQTYEQAKIEPKIVSKPVKITGFVNYFDADGTPMMDVVDTNKYSYGNSVTLKTANNVVGWKKSDGTIIDLTKTTTFDGIDNGNLNLYAVYPKSNVTLYYGYDATENGDVIIGKYEVDKGDTFTFPTNIIRQGYNLLGWATEKNANIDKIVKDSITIENYGQNYVYYAQWSPKTVTLAYNLNSNEVGGLSNIFINGSEISDPYKVELTYGSIDKSLLEISAKVGFKFNGWYLDKDFTKEVVDTDEIWEYVLSDNMNINEVNVYAQWITENISISVPTILSIKIDSSGSNSENPHVYVSNGTSTNVNDTNLQFINYSSDGTGAPVDVMIKSVTVNTIDKDWKLGSQDEAKTIKISLVGEDKSETVLNSEDNNGENKFYYNLNTADIIDGNMSSARTNIIVKVDVGGTNNDYQEEMIPSTLFTLEWGVGKVYN